MRLGSRFAHKSRHDESSTQNPGLEEPPPRTDTRDCECRGGRMLNVGQRSCYWLTDCFGSDGESRRPGESNTGLSGRTDLPDPLRDLPRTKSRGTTVVAHGVARGWIPGATSRWKWSHLATRRSRTLRYNEVRRSTDPNVWPSQQHARIRARDLRLRNLGRHCVHQEPLAKAPPGSPATCQSRQISRPSRHGSVGSARLYEPAHASLITPDTFSATCSSGLSKAVASPLVMLIQTL